MKFNGNNLKTNIKNNINLIYKNSKEKKYS